MERILIRYVLRNKHTQALHFKTHYLEQIEEGGIGKMFDIENYTIISRDRFSGLHDKSGKLIFERDVCIDVHGHDREIKYEYGSWTWEEHEDPQIYWSIVGHIYELNKTP